MRLLAQAAHPGQLDASCNLVDEDCDGVADEDSELLAYNEYLATLADREQRHAG